MIAEQSPFRLLAIALGGYEGHVDKLDESGYRLKENIYQRIACHDRRIWTPRGHCIPKYTYGTGYTEPETGITGHNILMVVGG